MGRHEGARGLKPPITVDDHDAALLVEKRGRHEGTPSVFLSSFSGAGDAHVIPASGGRFATSQTIHREDGLGSDEPGI